MDAAVRSLLAEQVEAWNAGSVRGFMAGYAATDSMTFLSGGSVRQGWQASLDAYVRGYPTPEAMGTLAFESLVVRPLSARHALVWGRWRLAYPEGGRPEASGLFTLLVEDTRQGWRVVHDHTSSAG